MTPKFCYKTNVRLERVLKNEGNGENEISLVKGKLGRQTCLKEAVAVGKKSPRANTGGEL